MLSKPSLSLPFKSLNNQYQNSVQFNKDNSLRASSFVTFGKNTDAQRTALLAEYPIEGIGFITGTKLLKVVQDASRLSAFNLLDRILGRFNAQALTVEDIAGKLGLKLQTMESRQAKQVIGQINQALEALSNHNLLDQYTATNFTGVMARPAGEVYEWAPKGAKAMTAFVCPY